MPEIAKNLQHESSPPTCGCGTWIRHWENNNNEKLDKCCALGCFHKADRGGHILREDTNNKKWYIIPICASHNNQFGKEFSISDKADPVPIGKTSKCKL